MWYNVNYVYALLRNLINLTVPFRSPLSQTLASFSSSSHFSLSLSLWFSGFSLGFDWSSAQLPQKKKISTLGKFPTVDRPNWVKSPKFLSHDQSLLSLSFSPQSSELCLWPELLLPLLAGESLILSPGFFKKCCIPVPVPVFVHHRLSLETTTILSILFMEEL